MQIKLELRQEKLKLPCPYEVQSKYNFGQGGAKAMRTLLKHDSKNQVADQVCHAEYRRKWRN